MKMKKSKNQHLDYPPIEEMSVVSEDERREKFPHYEQPIKVSFTSFSSILVAIFKGPVGL